MASKNMTTQQRAIDNMIRKLNKRLVVMAKTGMEVSSVFMAITATMHRVGADAVAKYEKFSLSNGVQPKAVSPIRYVTVMGVDGSMISVPQLSRGNWALNTITAPDLSAWEEMGTGRAEREAMREYLETAVYPGTKATDEDITQAFASVWMNSDMLNYVWDYLYGLKHISEVSQFFNAIPEHYQPGDLDKYNAEAARLYGKYASQVDSSSVRERSLSRQQKAVIWGAKDKSGRHSKGLAAKALERGMNATTETEKTLAAQEYLGVTKATGGYGAQNGVIKRYQPTAEEVEDTVAWFDFIKGATGSPVPERWKK